MSLGHLISEAFSSSEDPRMCDCAGRRAFEALDEPPVLDKYWHVCPCCGKRVLLDLFPEASL